MLTLRVEGATSCPTAAEVEARLPAGAPSGRVATLAVEGDALRIELRDASGARLYARTLPLAEACADLAAAAALILAAWDAELSPGRPPPPKLPAPPRPRPVDFDVGGGFVAALAGSAFAPGGQVDLDVFPRRRRFGGRFAFVGTDLRAVALPPGRAEWTRLAFQLGPAARFRPSRFLLDVHAALHLAVLLVRGVGFSSTREELDLDPGLGFGARAAVRLGPVAPYLGAALVGWLRAQKAVVANAGEADLPRLDVQLSVGLAFGAW